MPGVTAASARRAVQWHDGRRPVRPFDGRLKSGPTVQPEGKLVFGLYAELDATGATSAQASPRKRISGTTGSTKAFASTP